VAVKLHRCSWMWFKIDGHPCWKVQKALDEADVDYEVVQGPAFPRGRRKDVQRISGQTKFPAIEFEDGSGYRDESSRMAEEIRAGKLFDHAGSGTAPA
jgi:glutathione S-transferase